MLQNVLVTVIFFVILIVMLSVYIYHLYDYIDYKESVDKSIGISTQHINKGFGQVTTNSTNISKRLDDMMSIIDSIKIDLQDIKNNSRKEIGSVKQT